MPIRKPSQSRGVSLERLFRIAERLRNLRFGATIEQLQRDVGEAMEQTWHERTIHRDVDLLVCMGVVDADIVGSGRGRYRRCKWVGEDFFAIPVDRVRTANVLE